MLNKKQNKKENHNEDYLALNAMYNNLGDDTLYDIIINECLNFGCRLLKTLEELTRIDLLKIINFFQKDLFSNEMFDNYIEYC